MYIHILVCHVGDQLNILRQHTLTESLGCHNPKIRICKVPPSFDTWRKDLRTCPCQNDDRMKQERSAQHQRSPLVGYNQKVLVMNQHLTIQEQIEQFKNPCPISHPIVDRSEMETVRKKPLWKVCSLR
jgi:hypothetical protein